MAVWLHESFLASTQKNAEQCRTKLKSCHQGWMSSPGLALRNSMSSRSITFRSWAAVKKSKNISLAENSINRSKWRWERGTRSMMLVGSTGKFGSGSSHGLRRRATVKVRRPFVRYVRRVFRLKKSALELHASTDEHKNRVESLNKTRQINFKVSETANSKQRMPSKQSNWN